jgi:hypothetical protein
MSCIIDGAVSRSFGISVVRVGASAGRCTDCAQAADSAAMLNAKSPAIKDMFFMLLPPLSNLLWPM